MTKRKALGKGLESLIPQAPPRSMPPQPNQSQPVMPNPLPTTAPPTGVVPTTGLHQIDLDRITPNQDQPRQKFEQGALEELARSLKQQGLLQPVVVRPMPDGKFQLIAGERRWRAAQLAGLLRIPALVREVKDDQVLELALIENLQREELNPIESAAAFQTLIDDLGLSQQDVAHRVGKQRSTITNALRLLNLPPEIQDLIAEGNLSAGHAKALASLANTQAQIEMAARIVKDGLSVRQVEALVASHREPKPDAESTPSATVDPNVMAATEQLQRAYGTKVRILQNKKGAGRLELHFFSNEELERVYQILMRIAR